ncbi:MAG: hypothetical protein LBR77_09220, partial [Lachnospiraceae bacterium]|nr:hypothetical protein [Lachnospiraceae bacterium]
MEPIKLQGGDIFITGHAADAYRVEAGDVFVYIVPLRETPGRRAFLCRLEPGAVIPSLCHRDAEYTQWRFAVVAVGSAALSSIPGGNTQVLKRRFAARIPLENVDVEGFENACVDAYKLILVAEDGLALKTARERDTTSENILKLIYNAFGKRQQEVGEPPGRPLYRSVSIICQEMGIPLAPLEKVQEACPGGFDVRDIARISHFPCREVSLETGWHRKDMGPLLIFDGEGTPVACIPKGQDRYTAYVAGQGRRTGEDTVAATRAYEHDRTSPGGRHVGAAPGGSGDGRGVGCYPVTEELAGRMGARAYAIYRPFPATPLGMKDLLLFGAKSVNVADVVQIAIFTAVCAGAGMLLPLLCEILYDKLIPLGYESQVFVLGAVIASVMVGRLFFSVAKSIANFRVVSRVGAEVQCAVTDRLFHLPERFLRRFESADLAQDTSCVAKVVTDVVGAVFASGMTVTLSFVYFGRMVAYSGPLAGAALGMLMVYGLSLLLISWRMVRYGQQIEQLDGDARGKLYQYICGVAKLRMAGAQDRALYQYLRTFVAMRGLVARKGYLAGISAAMSGAAGGIFSIVLFGMMVWWGGGISLGEFI